ncbi:T9SS type A sorting domain-containing protein, partial [Flavobacterium sp.]|uniref:T9SS type A sorting domain-containing protein n=1 Tax=Flavobacterium sp. TaxID=239 RepID=UPI0025E30DF8
MKRKMFLIVVALVLLVTSAFNMKAQVGFNELDPNILWVADSSIGRIDGFAVHPNGNVFAYKNGFDYGSGQPNIELKVFEIDGTNGKLLRILPISLGPVELSSIDISSDGSKLAVSWNQIVIIDLQNYSTINFKRASLVKFVPNSSKITYSGLGSQPGTTGSDSSIVILDLETQQRAYIKTEEMITKIAFSPDGRFLATGGSGQDVFGKSYVSLKLWDANTLKLIKELEKIENSTIAPSKIKFSNDNKLVGFWRSWDNLLIFNIGTMIKLKDYRKNNTNLEISDFAFISSDYVGVQSKKISIIRLVDDYVISLMDSSARGSMEINNENNVLFSSTGSPALRGPLTAFDLKKVFTGVDNKSMNSGIKIQYQKGRIQVQNLQIISPEIKIKILDINGKVIKDLNLTNVSSEFSIPVNLNSGTYLIHLKDGSREYSYN